MAQDRGPSGHSAAAAARGVRSCGARGGGRTRQRGREHARRGVGRAIVTAGKRAAASEPYAPSVTGPRGGSYAAAAVRRRGAVCRPPRAAAGGRAPTHLAQDGTVCGEGALRLPQHGCGAGHAAVGRQLGGRQQHGGDASCGGSGGEWASVTAMPGCQQRVGVQQGRWGGQSSSMSVDLSAPPPVCGAPDPLGAQQPASLGHAGASSSRNRLPMSQTSWLGSSSRGCRSAARHSAGVASGSQPSCGPCSVVIACGDVGAGRGGNARSECAGRRGGRC